MRAGCRLPATARRNLARSLSLEKGAAGPLPIGVGSRRLSQSRGTPSKLAGLEMEIGIEDADLGDALHRQSVALGDLADRLGRGAVIDAIGPLLVRGDIGMDPSDALLCIV